VTDGSLPGGPILIGAAQMAGPAALTAAIDALAAAFADLAAGRTASPGRTVVDSSGGRQLVVGPAVWEPRGVASVKVTTLTPGNPERGLPLIHGVVVLTDLGTGRVAALLDGGELTAVRTGAVAGLATRLCAPPDAADVAIVGAGVQGRALLRAVCAVRPITSVRVFSRTRASAEAFGVWARADAAPGARVTVCGSGQDAVRDAAVICTATSVSGQTPVLEAGWVAPGAHVNAIGGTHEDAIEVDPALLATAAVVVEERAAALADAGEVRAGLAAGLIGPADLYELGDLVTGAATTGGRTSVFRSVGLAVEDTAAAAALWDQARNTSRDGAAAGLQ